LRSKHIDTLEVLEEYSRDVAKLQKENKQLQQQLSKLTALNGGGGGGSEASLARIEQLEADLEAQRSLQSQLAQLEAERARVAQLLAAQEGDVLAAKQQVSSLRSELHVLSETHRGCLATRHTLSEQIAALSRTNLELNEKAQTCQTQVEEHKQALERQSERLQQLEIQATLGPPLPLSAAKNAASSSTEDSKTARELKAKNQKAKAQLRDKDALLAQQHDQVEQLRAQLAAANSAAAEQTAAHKQLVEAHKKLQGEAATLQQHTASAASSERRQSHARNELARREREWAAEKRVLQQELEQARRTSAANMASPAPVSSSRGTANSSPSKTESELLERVAHLQSELRSVSSTAETLHAQNQLLRTEHEKVSKAFNKVLAAGGGGGGLAATGAPVTRQNNDTITIASKRSGFPELIAARRECDALKIQVADLQHALMVAQGRPGGGGFMPPTAAAATTTAASGAQSSGQPHRSSGATAAAASTARGALGSSKSLALIAAHEREHGAPVAAAQPVAGSTIASSSPGSSPPHTSSGSNNVGRQVPVAGRRSSGGWPTAAVAVGSGAGAARIKR
jgi:myosin heavy subunit